MRFGLFLLLVAMAACRTAPTAPAPVLRGGVSLTLLPDPAAPQVELSEGQDFRAAWLAPDNPLPQYPAALIPLGLSPQSLAARLLLAEDGTVTYIGPSPLRASTTGPHQAEFERAVKSAVASWRGGPPRVRQFVPGPDSDGDGEPDFERLEREQVLKAYFDVVFVFEVSGGEASVRTTAP